MKKFILICFAVFCLFQIQAQHQKKDGTPDKRYKENKNSASDYSVKNNVNTDVRYQNSYNKSNGTHVNSHYKTANNETNHDNFSTKDNKNPYTGKNGSKAKDYSSDAKNYGKGKTINEGSKNGQYYVDKKGNKVYVPKR